MRGSPQLLLSLKEPNLYDTTAGAVQSCPAQRNTLMLCDDTKESLCFVLTEGQCWSLMHVEAQKGPDPLDCHGAAPGPALTPVMSMKQRGWGWLGWLGGLVLLLLLLLLLGRGRLGCPLGWTSWCNTPKMI